jgi:integrase/recombinase XerC
VTSDTAAVSASQPGETTSDITEPAAEDTTPPPRRRPGRVPTALPPEYAQAYADYQTAITTPGGPLDPDTVRAYCSRLRQYLAWLAGADARGDPLSDPVARDWAVRDYRTHLLTVAKRKAATVNAHLAALDDFYRRAGLGPAVAKRQDLPNTAPRALDKRTQTQWLRAVERASPRDRALAYTEFYAGLRGAEATGLDTGDLRLSARKGHLIVRYGKGGRYREVPLHPKLRTALQAWLDARQKLPTAKNTPALFLNHRGKRLSTRGAYDVLKTIAEDANLETGRDGVFTPHVLRHTAGTTMIREGQDIVTVAEILGHSIETARRYSLPSASDKQHAIERLTVDE